MEKDLANKVNQWLPISKKEMEERGWDQADIILITGDAYVDHPAFGSSVIGRLLESKGYKTAILPQPNWRDDLRDFKKLGKPRLFFGISSGAMDSMINHYTANKRLRSDDAYTAGGKAGFRPDHAAEVYSKIVRKLFPDSFIILGGVEASMRRFAHYDYWEDEVRDSILSSSGADILLYGMGERSILEIADMFSRGKNLRDIQHIEQLAYISEKPATDEGLIMLPSAEDCRKSKNAFAKAARIFEIESNKYQGGVLCQKNGDHFVIQNPAFPPGENLNADEVHALAFTRQPHPRYAKRGNIPAYEMIRNSINIHRGCFGGCSFCAIAAHQGRWVVSRSEESILKEVEAVRNTPGFNGVITDLGGPSANMFRMQGKDISLCKKCKRASCIFPKTCSNLNFDHKPLIELYEKVRKTAGIKRVFIGSGIRYDMLVGQEDKISQKYQLNQYIKQVTLHHVSGRLKVAPEHSSDKVLKLMRKPSFRYYHLFRKKFIDISEKAGKNQMLIPYLMSSHPGCDISDMALLAIEMKKTAYKPEQVQDFTPTPGTLATAMYYTGINPLTGDKVFRTRSIHQKKDQQSFFFYYKGEYRKQITQILKSRNLSDFIPKIFPPGTGSQSGRKRRR